MPGRGDTTGDAGLLAALSELYAVAPEGFVGTRTALVQDAKARGDAALAKEVGRLRRPTVAAWAVNQVVRRRPSLVGRLHDVGGRLRAAQAGLDASAMRDLRSERDGLLAAWAEAAAEVAAGAGRPLAPAALEEVRGTVIAALASGEATEAAVSGHLTRALGYSGFGEVDLSEAVVRTSSGAVLTVVDGVEGERAPKAATSEATASKAATSEAATSEAATEHPEAAHRQAEREERARRLARAAEAQAAAAAAAEEAALAVASARDRADEVRWRVEELEEQLRRARQEHRDAEQSATAAARSRRAAVVALAAAERALRAAEADSPS
ncbi:hypothetical protein P0Y31_03440 [Knoellia sp. 3-2P3]|uniref:hypothetical protein n=1 Tax=unclassified Knoellia TaxID=2618719 RepID=UPI0023DBBC31|nr:hypothetical protein [Knoellia sp. 3-2P3]MDF2091386.1 hypothetical protein [Knoellia sp. 3-2P3]